MHPLFPYLIPKLKLILLYDLIIAILFSIVYYTIQFISNDSFVRSMNQESEKDPRVNNFSFLECIHFSLVTQSTLGYGDMIPKRNIAVIINSMQILTIYIIPLIIFQLK